MAYKILGKRGYQDKFEPGNAKTNTIACALSENSDQPEHPPSMIGVFAVRMKNAMGHSYSLSAQQKLSTDWADALVYLSLCLAHMLVCWFCQICFLSSP